MQRQSSAAPAAELRVRHAALPASRTSRWIAYCYLVSVPFEIDLVLAGRSLSFWLAAALIGAVLVDLWVKSGRRTGYKLNGQIISASLFLLFYTSASYFWSVDRDATLVSALVFGFTIATWAALAVAVSGVVNQAFHALVAGTSLMSIMALVADVNIDGRAELAANVNDVAALLAIASAYLLSATIRQQASVWSRLIYLGLLFLHLLAILATGSRTGVLALTASAVVLFFLTLLRARYALVFATLFLILVVAYIAPSLESIIPARLAAIPAALSAGDLSNRETYWGLALDEIPSLVGIGFGATPSWLGVPTAVMHSVYLGVALELGIIGVLLWGRFVWLLIKSARMSPEALSLITAAAAVAVMASTLTLEARRPLWVLFALMAAHGFLLKKRGAER